MKIPTFQNKLFTTILSFFLIAACFLSAEKLDISIQYFGLRVVKVNIEQTKDSILIHAKASSIASIASKMDNYYATFYNGSIYPAIYEKNINQKGYSEKRKIIYNRELLFAERISMVDSTRNKTYPIHKESLDFFSAIMFLRNNLSEKGTLWIDANSLIWRTEYKIVAHEKIKTFKGKVNCIKLKIDFVNVSGAEKERSDMLTNNLVSEDNSLYIWLTDDNLHLPVRAVFKMSPFSVVWKLNKYES